MRNKPFAFIQAFALLLICASLPGKTCHAAETKPLVRMPASPLVFVQNVVLPDGQNPNLTKVLFTVTSQGLKAYVKPTGLSFVFSKPISSASGSIGQSTQKGTLQEHQVDLNLLGANPNPKVVCTQASTYTEYHVSQNPEQPAIEAKSYKTITFKNIYPKVDWVLRTTGKGMEYDFVVQPGGNASQIRMQYFGQDSLVLASKTALNIHTSLGTIHEGAIEVRQGEKKIAASFIQDANTIAFAIGRVDKTKAFTIDPPIVWSSFYGVASFDYVYGLATDRQNNVYFTGSTISLDGLASAGARQVSSAGEYDALLVKFSPTGQRLWATYFGGVGNEAGYSIACDANNNIYLGGGTQSARGIATANTFRDTLLGNSDAFLSKWTSNGQLVWSTYFGGTGQEYAYCSVAADALGDVFLAGVTTSTNRISTAGTHQSTLSGGYDAYLAKFNSQGQCIWGTYFGGTGQEDKFMNVSTDTRGNAYLASRTSSSSQIATTGAHQATFGGGTYDAFLAKFRPNGSLHWATYFGGNLEEDCRGSVVDFQSNVFISGNTKSSNNIASSRAWQGSYGGGANDAFLAKFDSLGFVLWSTYVGGNSSDYAGTIATDTKNVFLGGYTASPNAIATSDAFQTTTRGSADAFLIKYNTVGEKTWGTYWGANLAEYATGLACDNLGKVFMCGWGEEGMLMDSANSFQPQFGGSPFDGFLIKWDVPNGTVSASSNQVANHAKIWPNPACSTLNFSSLSSGAISIYNSQGPW